MDSADSSHCCQCHDQMPDSTSGGDTGAWPLNNFIHWKILMGLEPAARPSWREDSGCVTLYNQLT
ncbi:hypothetical protein EMIT0P43_10181 [Pseudomonas jessenii]